MVGVGDDGTVVGDGVGEAGGTVGVGGGGVSVGEGVGDGTAATSTSAVGEGGAGAELVPQANTNPVTTNIIAIIRLNLKYRGIWLIKCLHFVILIPSLL